jgi:hypothetical protein
LSRKSGWAAERSALLVSPFAGQGPVEAFGFAALPRTVGFDEFVSDAVLGEQLAQLAAAAVAERVVGHQTFDTVAPHLHE